MEKANKLRLKREACRKRKESARKDLLMIAYVNKKYPLIYKEAEIYYNKLDESNQSKIDLRKTKEFRALKETAAETVNDRMVLEIPITSGSNEHPQNIQDKEHPLPDDLQGIQGIMEDELQQDLIESIIKDLKNDPYISKLMDELETELDKGINPFDDDDDIELDIEIDDRLEEELML